MRFLSLFSGIEAASVAWVPLGWECVAVSEIDPFPCAVLKHRFPDVPNLGDVTKITEKDIEALGRIDLVVFGSPCQDLSVAGKRVGFTGERSGLFYPAIDIIRWARKHGGCRFALWENVPGAFSSNQGRDFAAVVEEMAGLRDVAVPANGWGTEGVALGDYGLLEWSVLDAQWFGVAQRRRRVFAIVDFGSWENRRPILLERQSMRGDFAPSREAGESIAPSIAPSLRGQSNASHRLDSDAYVATYQPVAHCLNAGGMGRQDYETESFVIHGTQDPCVGDVAFSLGRNSGQENVLIDNNCLNPDQPQCWRVYDPAGVSPSLQSGEGRGNAILSKQVIPQQEVIAIQNATRVKSQNGLGITDHGGPMYTLDQGSQHAVAFHENQQAQVWETDVMQPLNTGGGKPGQSYPAIRHGMSVRRLIPIECERLQGFPDDWTKISWRGKPADDCPDGHRYKALGNSMAVPVMRWIGQQIDSSTKEGK